MNALDTAIFNKISGNGAITALLGRTTAIYNGQAPQSTAAVPLLRPYIIFNQMSGVPAYTLSAKAYDRRTYLVKVVSESPATSPSKAAAGVIDDLLATLLTDSALTISGHTQLYTRRTGDMPPYSETNSSTVYHHVGGLYTVFTT